MDINLCLIRQVVEEIIREADELKAQAGNECKDDMAFGQLLAYSEALCIMQSAFTGYDFKELGLDFDVDKRYLINSGD